MIFTSRTLLQSLELRTTFSNPNILQPTQLMALQLVLNSQHWDRCGSCCLSFWLCFWVAVPRTGRVRGQLNSIVVLKSIFNDLLRYLLELILVNNLTICSSFRKHCPNLFHTWSPVVLPVHWFPPGVSPILKGSSGRVVTSDGPSAATWSSNSSYIDKTTWMDYLDQIQNIAALI